MKIPLQTGNIVFMRPPDRHSFAVQAGGEMNLINLAFPNSKIQFFKKHYFKNKFKWFDKVSKLPLMEMLSERQNRRIDNELELLAASSFSELELDRFLLNLFCLLSRCENSFTLAVPNCPDWFLEALKKMQNPKCFILGVPELSRLSYKSPEHVNRMAQKYLGMTATRLVNRIKLDYAKTKLQMTDDPILAISLDCGFNNLGHFYRVFKKEFHSTPRQCRLQAHSLM